jgi:hypothetical protein
VYLKYALSVEKNFTAIKGFLRRYGTLVLFAVATVLITTDAVLTQGQKMSQEELIQKKEKIVGSHNNY